MHPRTCLAARPDGAKNAQARSGEPASLKEDEKQPSPGAEPGLCLPSRVRLQRGEQTLPEQSTEVKTKASGLLSAEFFPTPLSYPCAGLVLGLYRIAPQLLKLLLFGQGSACLRAAVKNGSRNVGIRL